MDAWDRILLAKKDLQDKHRLLESAEEEQLLEQ
jgi:hypothetical protein